MAKLVLLLDDGTGQDILLHRERLTIGRRPDNDLCLPHPAVSAEHAAVTTILSDSFLEDLGSTNGTLVNGRVIQKHFLRDGDLVEVGRERLVYLQDEQGTVENIRQINPIATEHRSRRASALDAEIAKELEAPRRRRHTGAPDTVPGLVAPEPPSRQGAGVVVDEAALMQNWASTRPADVPAQPELVVLSGPRSGQVLPLVKDITSVGRAGVQVALVRRTEQGYVVCAAEGSESPQVNGHAIDLEGVLLAPGDVIEVAGSRVEFSAPPDLGM